MKDGRILQAAGSGECRFDPEKSAGALPEIIGQLRNAPEAMPITFKLYRNLDALYDVLGGVVEGAGAFGSKMTCRRCQMI